MDIELIEAAVEDKPVVQNLLELCEHDLSEFGGWDVTDHGLFGYHYLDHYWSEAGRYPFLVRVGGRLAGLALIRDVQEQGAVVHVMAEFFVLRKYRRQGVGRGLALLLFDRFPGRWRVEQIPGNDPALAFWRKVIGEYTGGRFAELDPDAPSELGGTGQVFETPPSGDAGGS